MPFLTSTPNRSAICDISGVDVIESTSSSEPSKLDKLIMLARENSVKLNQLLDETAKDRSKTIASKGCAAVIRQTYSAMPAGSQWTYDDSYQAPENKTSTNAVTDEVVKEYGAKYSRDEIRAGCKVYWRSLRDRHIRVKKGTSGRHTARVKRNYRIRAKLECRKKALSSIDWTTTKRKKVEVNMTLEYMSSEDDDDGARVVLPLRWESSTLRRYKDSLDKEYLGSCKQSQLRLMKETRRSDCKYSSRRDPPHDAPNWCTNSADFEASCE